MGDFLGTFLAILLAPPVADPPPNAQRQGLDARLFDGGPTGGGGPGLEKMAHFGHFNQDPSFWAVLLWAPQAPE